MGKGEARKDVVLILPYLKVNSTSALRFKSFIKAFDAVPNIKLKVFVVNYPHTKPYFRGLEVSVPVDDGTLPADCQEIVPSLNIVQKMGFRFLNNGNYKHWKICQLLHLLVYRTDIFKLGKNDISVKTNSSGGYVICSGSHFSLFSAASNLSVQLNYKLVLDYRDPWTYGYTPIDGFKLVHVLKKTLQRSKELKFLKQASLVTTVSSSLKLFFPAGLHHKIDIIPNGSNFSAAETGRVKAETFNIVYAGTIYQSQLMDDIFFSAFKIFVANKKPQNICLYFLGAVHNQTLLKTIHDFGLEDFCVVTKRLIGSELLAYYKSATVFLHLKYGSNQSVITSKQADYLAFCKPILLPNSDYGDIAKSITDQQAGYVCTTVEENVSVLEQLWGIFLNGEEITIPQSKEFLLKNTREYIAGQFVERVLNS